MGNEGQARPKARQAQPGKLYQETAALLRRAIETGRWQAGERLPTLDMIASEFDVSLITVRQAVSILRTEGLLLSRHGVGTFVPPNLKGKTWIDLQWGADVQSLGGVASPNTARILEEMLDATLPGCGREGGYVFLKRVHYRQKIPYAVASLHIHERLFGNQTARFRNEMVLPLVLELARDEITRARQSLTIGTADMDAAGHLDIKPNSPIGELQRTVFGRDDEILFSSFALYRGDIVRIETDVTGISPLAPLLP